MDAIELLRTRASNGKLTDPAPDEMTLKSIFEAAVRAPDHAALRPWRIRIVRGEGRERLGEVFAEALKRRVPGSSDEQLAKVRSKPLRAPLLIVVGAAIERHPKVPEIEQILSAGAVAQNILLGLHAYGYAAMWRTGDPAYDPHVKKALGMKAGDAIVAFIYVGTASAPAPRRKRPTADRYVEEWHGPPEPE